MIMISLTRKIDTFDNNLCWFASIKTCENPICRENLSYYLLLTHVAVKILSIASFSKMICQIPVSKIMIIGFYCYVS